MAHEVAELASADGNLGPVGHVVSIAEVRQAYRSSRLANARTRYVCADCRVPVSAVLPLRNKVGRLRTPSDHFRASGQHANGCTRFPRVVLIGGTTANQMAARPVQGPVPVIWSNLPATTAVAPTQPQRSASAGTSAPSAAGARVTQPGAGASVAHSYLVEKFAKAYLQMNGPQMASTPLQAPWNPGGTYSSGFVVLQNAGITGGPHIDDRIYVGEISRIHLGQTGFTIDLTERHKDGSELRLWLQNVLQHAHPGGAHLWSRLVSAQVTAKMLVFALGGFQKTTKAGGGHYYSMPVIDPRFIWVVDPVTVHNIMNTP